MMMENLYEMYATDKAMEQEGFWFALTPKVHFLLARTGGANARYLKCLEAKTRPYRRQIQDETIELELVNQLAKEAFAETIILGWKGVKDASNKEVKFSAANARKLVTDLDDLFGDLRDAASKRTNFQQGELEDDAGN